MYQRAFLSLASCVPLPHQYEHLSAVPEGTVCCSQLWLSRSDEEEWIEMFSHVSYTLFMFRRIFVCEAVEVLSPHTPLCSGCVYSVA